MKILLALYNNKHIALFPRQQEERARTMRREDPRMRHAQVKKCIFPFSIKVKYGHVYDRNVPLKIQIAPEAHFSSVSESAFWAMLKENQIALVGNSSQMFYRDGKWVVRVKGCPFDDPETSEDPATSFVRMVRLEGLS